jgi:predicted ABC-type transport system involved in lysophospholipase L1 biosynthesis ATPase subunit
MIYQELTLAPHLSVEENLLLGEEPARFGWIRGARRRELARVALAELDAADIPLDAPVRELPIARQQLVEIARALIGEPKVLIMDEPTSSLPRAAAEHLFTAHRPGGCGWKGRRVREFVSARVARRLRYDRGDVPRGVVGGKTGEPMDGARDHCHRDRADGTSQILKLL